MFSSSQWLVSGAGQEVPMVKQKKIIVFVFAVILFSPGFLFFKTIFSSNSSTSEIASFQQKRETFHKQDLEKKYPSIEGFWPYIPLFFQNGLEWDLVNEWSDSKSFRVIMTAKGEEHVSIVAGFRVLYKFPNTDYFSKMHVEKSQSENYETDKQKVIDNLNFVAKDLRVTHDNKSQFEVYYSGQTSLESAPVLGMALIFFPKDQIITTVYFLNQQPSKRKFQTFEEYEKLKDQFIEEIISHRQKSPT
jgi:hypothetical protein